MPAPSRVLAPVAVAALALSLTGCGFFGGSAAPTSAPAVAAETLTVPDGIILSANSTAELGTVVIDAAGFTLYRYDGDSAEPPASTCTDDCATAWPPLLATPGSPMSLEGVDQELVGTVTRPDGGVQVTLGGWPIYRYAAETAPGETGGHGNSEQWFAIAPDGERAEAP